jgi:hypothetical protein
MKTSTLIAAVSLAFAGAAFAQEATYQLPQPAVSQKTRAEVIAELQQARANGQLTVTEAQRQAYAPFVSTRTRADVRAETLAALASGEVRALSAEPSGFDLSFGHAGGAGHGRIVAAAN